MSCGEQLIYLGGRVGIIWYPASLSYPTGADDLPHQVPLLLAGSRSVFLFHLQQSSKHPLGLVLLSSTDWFWLSHSDTEQSSTPFFPRGAFLRRPSLGRSEDRLIGLRKGSCTLHPSGRGTNYAVLREADAVARNEEICERVYECLWLRCVHIASWQTCLNLSLGFREHINLKRKATLRERAKNLWHLFWMEQQIFAVAACHSLKNFSIAASSGLKISQNAIKRHGGTTYVPPNGRQNSHVERGFGFLCLACLASMILKHANHQHVCKFVASVLLSRLQSSHE